MFSLRQNKNYKNKELLATEFIETPYLLFLDFDGVLHPDFADGIPRDRVFERLPLIENWLRDHLEVTVVLTTAWRAKNDLKKLREYFSPDIQCRIIGVTPQLRKGFEKNGRYYEIKMFLTECGWLDKNYVILDDRAELFPERCEELILTKMNIGVEEEDLIKLTKKLNL